MKRRIAVITALLFAFVTAGVKYISAFPVIPKPEAEGALSWDLKLGSPYVLKGGEREMLLNIRLSGKEAGPGERTPVNLVLVIDRSGSMSDRGKMEYAREAARRMVGLLGKDDRLGIVAYSTDVEVLLPARKIADKEAALSVINSLYPTDSTNLSGGLEKGIAELKSLERGGYVNRVILLSDGLANQGVTDPSGLGRIASRASEGGVYVTTMGLGADYDENLMMGLAEHGAGNYYFIESPNQLAGIFEKEFGRMAAAVARDTVIKLALAPGVRIDEVYGYEYSVRDGSAEVKLGDFFGGQERDILVRLTVPADADGRHGLAAASLSYGDLLRQGSLVSSARTLAYEVTSDADKVAAGEDESVRSRLVSVAAASVYRKAAVAYESGDAEGARSYLEDAYDSIVELNKTSYKNERTMKQERDLREAVRRMAAPPAPSSEEGRVMIKGQKAGAREAQK
ncbi:MAG TPA: VWA domain-containing protein [Thermodesulfobacteriota bacterium]|nr:VWA domain-containing protein [Thermodesulfobacteriota bacterium]